MVTEVHTPHSLFTDPSLVRLDRIMARVFSLEDEMEPLSVADSEQTVMVGADIKAELDHHRTTLLGLYFANQPKDEGNTGLIRYGIERLDIVRRYVEQKIIAAIPAT